MKMDTLGTGRRTSNQRRSRRNEPRSKSRARTQSISAKPRSRGATSRGGQTRGQGRRRGGAAQSTTDLNEIRQWSEARGGKPVSVIGTSKRGGAGLLRIDFPGYSGAGRFQEISWDDWYQKFQESNLEFLYQDKTTSGQQSRFFKLVCRGTANKGSRNARARSSAQRRGTSRSGGRSRSKR